MPAKIGTPETLRPVIFRLKGIVGERRDVYSAEEMVHGGIAHDRNILHRTGTRRGGSQEVHEQGTDPLADHGTHFCQPRFGERKIHPAHDIGAVRGLRIQPGLHGQYPAAAQIDQLSNERGRSQVNGNAEPGSRLEAKRGVIGQDGGLPLIDLENEVVVSPAAAGEAPACG